MRTASRLRLPTTVTAVVVLVVTACGGAAAPSSSHPRPAAPSAQALAAVRGAAAGALSETAAVSMSFAGATAFGGSSSSATASGSFDFRALKGAIALAPAGAKGKQPIIFGPAAVYVRPASAGPVLPAGKSWMVADFTDPEALTSNFPRFIAQVESVNPGLTVSELVWGATSAAAAGRDTVHGEGAARYELTLDLDQALANASGTAYVPFGRAIATEVKALGASTRITAHAWVTDAGRLARVELLPPGAGVGTLTMTLSGFGGAVHADPPPTSQIVDVLTLTPGGERENKNGGDADGG